MKKGFTLLELIIVIIIIGVLATLGLTQYGRMVERSRGAEAHTILGTMRTLAATHHMQTSDFSFLPALNNNVLNVGAGADQIPIACSTTHYFSYALDAASVIAHQATFVATRCPNVTGNASKRPPGGAAAGTTLTLTSNFATGDDTWGGTGNY